ATKGVPLDPSAGSQFGWDLAIGNFGRGSALDLAIDAPGQTIGDGGGAVFVLFHSATGITGIGSVALTRQTPGVPGDPSELGWGARSLAAGSFGRGGVDDLAVAAFQEHVGDASCGAAYVLYGRTDGIAGTDSKRFTLNTLGIGGTCNPKPNPTDFGSAL